jgi:hypothetical protein
VVNFDKPCPSCRLRGKEKKMIDAIRKGKRESRRNLQLDVMRVRGRHASITAKRARGNYRKQIEEEER